MASERNDTVFPEEDLDDDDQTLEDEEDLDDDVLGEPDEDEDEEPEPSPYPISAAAASVTVALPATVIPESPDPKRPRTEEKKATPLDDSRRLFQRLWTDEDEIGLLQGFLEYSSQRGSSHHNDTALFYDQIKSKLQLGFNKNQLVEKLRRLKKKYRNVLSKISSGKEFSFKSPHDQATFEISRKIWSVAAPIAGPGEDDDEINLNSNPNPNYGHLNEATAIEKKTPPSRKRSRPLAQLGVIKIEEKEEKRELNDDSVLNKDKDNNYNLNNHSEDYNGNIGNGRHSSMKGLIEETVRSCVTPVLKELASGANSMGSPFGFGGRGFGVGGFESNHLPLGLLNFGVGEMVKDEKWRKQHILELEVYSKRLELVQGEIKIALEELRSAGAGAGGR